MTRVTSVMPVRRPGILVPILAFWAAACAADADTAFVVRTPHEAYEAQLRQAGLDTTALGREWSDAAARALLVPLEVNVPHREARFLDPARATALGYRIRLQRGQRLLASVDPPQTSRQDLRLFVDLFSLDETGTPRPVASADPERPKLKHLVMEGGDYLLRVQPELLRGGPVTISVAAGAGFPVAGRDAEAVGSKFGEARDGGRREHEGVDIFAPFGTPVIATVAGQVARVGKERLGGNVVWVRDSTHRLLYYAHLERAAVKEGRSVSPGDTLGFVGNTGNARHTSPHLHFAVYLPGKGPVDPMRQWREQERTPSLAGNVALMGNWARAATDGARVRTQPDKSAPVIARLPRDTPVEVRAALGPWYLARLPGVGGGYLAARDVRPLRPPERRVIASAGPLVTAPAASGIALDSVIPGETVQVLGRYQDHVLVRRPAGLTGWVSRASFQAKNEAARSEPQTVARGSGPSVRPSGEAVHYSSPGSVKAPKLLLSALALPPSPVWAEGPPMSRPVVGRFPKAPPETFVPSPPGLTVERYTAGLEVIWAMQFAPDGRLFLTERAGRIRVVHLGGRLDPAPWMTLERVETAGQGGLLGLALHPRFPAEPWVYVMYTTRRGGALVSRVSRLKDVEGRAAGEEILLDSVPAGRVNHGGRLRFGPDGMLYVTVGDAGDRGRAQHPLVGSGGILRVTPEGGIPDGNPWPGLATWAYGLRNPIALAFRPRDHALLAADHGPTDEWGDALRDRDELNLVRRGANYGWPLAVGAPGIAGVEDPLLVWVPSAPPGDMVFYDGELFPELRGDLLLATLASEALLRIQFKDPTSPHRVTAIERWFNTGVAGESTYGRLRAIAVGPDGAVYLGTSNRDGHRVPRNGDDEVLRIAPAMR